MTALQEETSLMAAVEWLGEKRTAMLFVDFRRTELSLPTGLSEKDDLFAEAPDDVRSEYSLHAVSNADLSKLGSLAEQVRERDTCVWVFSDLPVRDLLKGLKVYLAWYARPSVLRTQLEHGPKALVKGLLSGVHAVLLDVPGDEDYHVFANPEATINWNEFESQR